MNSASNSNEDEPQVRVAVVEDDATLNELLVMTMRAEGWEVEQTGHGVDALNLIRDWQPDVVIMDVMIPGIDGVEVVRRLRDRRIDVPVLFLTAKDELKDKLAGLLAGGDDYVTKPFSLEEVVLRLRALVRRSRASASKPGDVDDLLVVGDLSMNPQTFEVWRAGTPVELTATEFALLRYLMENPRIVLSKAQILDRVWNYDFGGKASVVEIYISYLRKKINALGGPMIRTVRGVGYSIKAADE